MPRPTTTIVVARVVCPAHMHAVTNYRHKLQVQSVCNVHRAALHAGIVKNMRYASAVVLIGRGCLWLSVTKTKCRASVTHGVVSPSNKASIDNVITKRPEIYQSEYANPRYGVIAVAN